MPGGVVILLPESFKAQVRRDFPTVPLDELDRIASNYKIERDHKPRTDADSRRDLDQLVKAAVDLRCKLLVMANEPAGAMFDAAMQAGDPSLQERSIAELTRLIGAAKCAVNEMQLPKSGRKVGAKSALVHRLAAMLSRIGITVNKRPKGAMVRLTDLILEAYGESPSDTRKVVAQALETIRRNEAD